MKKSIFCIAILTLVSLMSSPYLRAQTDESPKSLRPYVIGPRDKVDTKVLGEDQFSFEAFVDELGNFYVPFDDQPIHARCKTEQEVRAEVTERIAKFVRNPMVSFSVVERRKPLPVTVFGEVKTPSTVELYREANLMEILATVGGQTGDAGGIVKVFRPQIPMCAGDDVSVNWRNGSSDPSDVPSRMFSLSAIQSGDRGSNPVIYPGDIVFVDKASPVYINGEVKQPQGIYIKEGGLSLSGAIAMVGGPNPEANLKKVTIYRRKPNSQDRQLIEVDLKTINDAGQAAVMLEPYDEVVVGKRKKPVGELILDTVLKTGVSAIQGIGSGLTYRVLY